MFEPRTRFLMIDYLITHYVIILEAMVANFGICATNFKDGTCFEGHPNKRN